MNKYLALVALVCLAGVAGLEASRARDHLHWRLFKSTFGKVYASSSEEALRRSIFEATKRRVEEHNANKAQELGFKLGFSHLSDWTADELEAMNGLKYDQDELQVLVKQHQEEMPELLKRTMEVDVKDLPKEVDWRQVAGRVGAVKDQGHCGSCWAFATTGLLEGFEVSTVNGSTKTGKLVPLSEQNLIDCSDKNLGCRGGNPYYALADVGREQGIETEKDYPYQDKYGPVKENCNYNAKKSLMSNVVGAIVLDQSEEAIQKYVAIHGPVSVGISASQNLVDYKSGVVKDPLCDTTPVNHAVLVVGYGTDPKEGDYWIVVSKNSQQL